MTLVQDLDQSRSGTPWWAIVADLPDNRTGKWDESAEEGPDEGLPYAHPNVPYDQYRDDPRTGPYQLPGWKPVGSEGQPLNGLGIIPFIPFIGTRGLGATAPATEDTGFSFLRQPWFWVIGVGTVFVAYLILRDPNAGGRRRLARTRRRVLQRRTA